MPQRTSLCIFPHAHMGIFNCTYLNVRLLAWGVYTDTGKLLFKMAVPTYCSALNLRADLFCHCCFTLCPPVCSHRDLTAQALWRDHALPDPLTLPCFSHIGARPVLVKIVLSTMRSPSIPPAVVRGGSGNFFHIISFCLLPVKPSTCKPPTTHSFGHATILYT